MIEFNQLSKLFSFCLKCGASASISNGTRRGVHITIYITCNNGHSTCWSSFEHRPNFGANARVAAGILISGSTFSHFEDAMRIMNVGMLSERSFYRILRDSFPSHKRSLQ